MFALKKYDDELENQSEVLLESFKKSYQSLVNHNKGFSFEDILLTMFNRLGLDHNNIEEYPILKDWYNNVYHFNFIENLISDNLEEIIFHNSRKIQVVEGGRTKYFDFSNPLSETDFNLSVETQCLRNGVEWNKSKPFASFKSNFHNKSFRLTLIHSSALGEKNHKIFIRHLNESIFSLQSFSPDISLISEVRSLFSKKKNILISGSTGSGKTSFLKSILLEKSAEDHTIILEDTEEINSPHPFHTSMLSKGYENFSLLKYCEYAMRMRPDRMILGEMRGAEVVPFTLSMNNGHKGLMATVHANSAIDGISRTAMLFEFYSESKSITFDQIQKLICTNLDYVIHVENKIIKEVVRIFGYSDQKIRYEIIYSSNR